MWYRTGLMLLRSLTSDGLSGGRPSASHAIRVDAAGKRWSSCRPMDNSTPSTDHPSTGSLPSGDRLIAVDALRGFDMLWIVGAESMIPAMVAIDTLFSRFVARQLDHAAWQGFTFFDLIFPLFLFIVGIAIVFSLEKVKARGGLRAGWSRVLPRVLLLFVLGILYGGQGLADAEKSACSTCSSA